MRIRIFPLLLAGVLLGGPAMAANSFSLGGEGFRDTYKEPSATVDTHSDYVSATAGYTHENNGFFTGIDGRYSWGKSDYKSVSGTLNGTPEIESDLRLTTGFTMVLWHGHLMPYIGAGWRYYFDQGKGRATNLGLLAYDRHISQFYVPIGATWRLSSGAWTFAPSFEGGPLVWGRVSSHFAAIGVDEDAHNIQKHGYELRGALMVGRQYGGFSWEAGPFVRYWHVNDSDCIVTVNSPPNTCLLEPKNTRLQAGAALRVGF